jgi:hypothetical protein
MWWKEDETAPSMAKQFGYIEAKHHEFILQQWVFFAASAAAEGRVNVSPPNGAALRILSPKRVASRALPAAKASGPCRPLPSSPCYASLFRSPDRPDAASGAANLSHGGIPRSQRLIQSLAADVELPS